MKKIIFTIIVFCVFSPGNKIYSQENITIPYNIKEYFLLMPEHIINIDKKDRSEILKKRTYQEIMESGVYYQLDTLDYKNGYLKFETAGDGAGTIYEITYFILRDKTRLIAVNYIEWSMCCEHSHIKFYKIKNKVWTDVSSSVLPELKLTDFYTNTPHAKSAKSKRYFRYCLPQKGKDIKVKLADTFFEEMSDYDYMALKDAKYILELTLKWNNGNFILNK